MCINEVENNQENSEVSIEFANTDSFLSESLNVDENIIIENMDIILLHENENSSFHHLTMDAQSLSSDNDTHNLSKKTAIESGSTLSSRDFSEG